jgi:MerR family copper efflux transcriptional regulator
VSSDYRIKDVAALSGFTPATLRYYEEIGLLPKPDRTAAGYRVYDDSTIDRLAFIARAKQLGCRLEEIAQLAGAWDGGECGPVQDQLRTAVTTKLAQAEQQIIELTALTADLRRAATGLEQHRPEGACDDRCGCVSDPDAARGAVTFTTKRPATPDDAPVACSLGADQLPGQLTAWQALLHHVDQRTPLPGGVRLAFRATASATELIRLVTAEQECCRFFAFVITVDQRGLGLEVSAPADASPLVASLFGAAA